MTDVTKAGEKLKSLVNPNHKAYAGYDEIQKLADYKKTQIVVYDNRFVKTKTFYPTLKKVKPSRTIKPREEI